MRGNDRHKQSLDQQRTSKAKSSIETAKLGLATYSGSKVERSMDRLSMAKQARSEEKKRRCIEMK